MNRNPVAKYAGQFCRSSVVPNSKRNYAPSIEESIAEGEEEFDAEYAMQWISPSGDPEHVYLKENVDAALLTQMRQRLIAADCTFVRAFKNGEEIL